MGLYNATHAPGCPVRYGDAGKCTCGFEAARLRAERDVSRDAPAVGDVHSDARGSGARYNAGKPPMEMIPVWIVYEYARHFPQAVEGCVPARAQEVAHEVLRRLGDWQRGRLGIFDVARALPFGALEEAAHVFQYACTEKPRPYPMWNWAKGMPWSVPTACAVRHLLAILRDEDTDPETGLTHRGHVMCNLVMLAHYEENYPEGDDRPREIMGRKPERSRGEGKPGPGSITFLTGEVPTGGDGLLDFINVGLVAYHEIDCPVLKARGAEAPVCTCKSVDKGPAAS